MDILSLFSEHFLSLNFKPQITFEIKPMIQYQAYESTDRRNQALGEAIQLAIIEDSQGIYL